MMDPVNGMLLAAGRGERMEPLSTVIPKPALEVLDRPLLASPLAHLRRAGCDLLTIGQYLQPTRDHVPVVRYYPPEEFARIRDIALDLGFDDVESGPLVRSSFHAHKLYDTFKRLRKGSPCVT